MEIKGDGILEQAENFDKLTLRDNEVACKRCHKWLHF